MPTSSTDLWASALGNLTENDRQQLAFYNGEGRLEILSDLQVLAESAKEQCIKKRWQFSRPCRNGETIVLRDIFNKMVVWINVFKQVGDTAVQYDPGHAALPWAGVRFILQVAVGDIVKFDFVVEGAESIARMIGRFTIFEDIYLRRSSTSNASVDLENALVRLYSKILTYLSKAKSFFDQSSLKRILRSVVENEFESLAKEMDLEQSNVDRCATILEAEKQNDISDSLEALSIGQSEKHSKLMGLLHSLDGPILRMSSQLECIEDHLDKNKRYEILRWISGQPYLEHHEQISKNALAGTGRWLLVDPTYAKWHKGSTSSLLWLHGKVGAGKSTLVSIVIEDARRRSQAGQGPPPVYFYCSRSAAEPERSDPAAILSSIVRQLSCAEPGLPLLAPVIEKYERKGRGFSSQGLQIEESREIITKLIEYYPMTTIVIDALDECNPNTREMLLEAIETLLQDSSLGLLKVFLSSRDDQDITCTLREYPNLDIVSSKNSADIETFVREETEKLVKKRRLLRNSHAKDSLKALIIDEVSKGADGMFRWASLQLELLCTMKLDQDVRARLGRIPPKLEQLYQEIYEENLLNDPGEFGQSIVKNIMKWLLCAQRPMKSSEFCTAVVLKTAPTEELTKETVLDLCHNFVVFDDSLDVFRFAHLSVREFLEKQTEYMAVSCHLFAAETCILYFIGLTDWPAAKDFVQRHYNRELRNRVGSTAKLLGGFHQYSTKFWGIHCQAIGEEGRRNDPHFERIFRFLLSDASDNLSPLNTWIQFCRRGLIGEMRVSCLGYYLSPDSGWKPEDTVYFVACAYAFCEIIRTCMNEKTPEVWRRGCKIAIYCGEGEVLKILLSSRNEDEIPRNLVCHVARFMDLDILDWVIHKSKIEITSLLRDLIEDDPIRKDLIEDLVTRYKPSKISQTLLEYAARKFCASTFESLLRQSDDTAISWDSLLEQARQGGNGEVIMLLLDGKDVPVTTNLMRAVASSGDEKAMRLLLDRGDPKELTSDVITASVSNKNDKILPLLLGRVGPGAISKEAIFTAIRRGNGRALNSLLDGGYPMSQSLLNQAALYCDASTLRLLLDRGGLITGLVLRLAAGNHRAGADVISLLLSEAKDYCITMDDMIGMMKIAAYYNLPDVMRLLLKRAGDITVPEDVLTTVAYHPYGYEMTRILSSRDWDLTQEVLEMFMTNSESEEALQLILDRLQDIEITEKILVAAAGNTAFGDQLMGLLLDRMKLPDVIDPLLVEAAGNPMLGLEVILLLERRVGDISASQEAIERAARYGSMETVTFLLDHTSAPITEAVVLGAIRNDRSIAQPVLDRASDIPITRKIVYTAVRYGDPDGLRYIWKRAFTAGKTEDTTMDLAQAAIESKAGPEEKLKFLLDEVENVVFGPEAMISIARHTDPWLLLNMLIDNGIKLPITSEVLQAAVASISNEESLVTYLLDHSDEIKLTDKHFRAAAGAGHEKILRVLSTHCGMTEIPKKWLDIAQLHNEAIKYLNGTESHICIISNAYENLNVGVVTALLGRGVEPDVPDGLGRTPLCYAVLFGHIPMVQALLAAGANPNWMDREKRTPLFFAADGGHYDIVEILLDLGVATHLEDEDGDTPASIAKKRGHMRVFRLLEWRRQP